MAGITGGVIGAVTGAAASRLFYPGVNANRSNIRLPSCLCVYFQMAGGGMHHHGKMKGFKMKKHKFHKPKMGKFHKHKFHSHGMHMGHHHRSSSSSSSSE